MAYQAIGMNSKTLLKILFIVLCFSLSLACGGTGKIQKSLAFPAELIFPAELEEMRYFPPVFSKQKPEFATSKMHFHFVTATTKRLDSLFEASAEKFRISGKISKENIVDMPRIYPGISLVFRELDHNKSSRDVRIPVAIRSVLKREQSRFALAMLISPDFSTWAQTSPNLTGLIRREKRENSYIVKSGTIHVLIFDLEKNNIAFYRKRSGVKYMGNWRKFLDGSLTEIFSY